jgi:hypothetical protein
VTAKILELIDTTDTSALVRDQIGAILLIESAKQQELAAAANLNPQDYKLRVFTERSNPWAEWQDAPDPDGPQDGERDTSPIVNVTLVSGDYERGKSNWVDRQQTAGSYQIDCYGYGVSTAGPTGGHDPGDARAAFEAQRAYTLVRKILMSGQYAKLGFPAGTIGDRWPRGFKVIQPAIDGRAVQHVLAVQLDFEVTFNEFAPQYEGTDLEVVSVDVNRAETGELYFAADYDLAV